MYIYGFVFITFAVEIKSNDTAATHGITRRDLVNKQLQFMKQINYGGTLYH